MRLDGRIGDGDLPFDVAGREARQMLDALHPLARRIARLGVGIDQSEVGVRRKLPGPGDDAGGLTALAPRGEDAAGDLGRGHQRRREPQRFARQAKRLVGIGGFRLARLRRQQHGAAAERRVWSDMTVLARDGERIQRALVIARARLHVEQGVDAPGQLRIALDRLLGESPRRLVVVAAPGFEEQAAKAKQLRLGAIEHGLEGAPRRGPVALELGGLRPEQGGQGLARQVAAGDAGIALRKRAVADADGEEPAGQRVISLLPPPFPHVSRDGGGTREQIAQHRPEQDQQHDDAGDRERCRPRRWSRSDSRAIRR